MSTMPVGCPAGDESNATRVAAILEVHRARAIPAPHGLSWQVSQLLHAINGAVFDHHVSVDALRRRCLLRDHNVSSRFKHEVGVTIRDYINQRRLAAAASLLASGACNASDAAYAVGYDNQQTFNRLFKAQLAAHRARCIKKAGVRGFA